ncbi:hypothetical protein TSAR_010466 [Trichomalopsis sarcophagae]|uniref:THAP-type domain-containing protein n=1 Tax=Trichomalopsis sarcophagae TaxID=543379 RepID=A0A232EN44_9HYME|nr:hypothetical protein TSAR_010466 [Trichomalopsis sarcophagae]
MSIIRKKSGGKCAIEGCSSRARKNPDISFHRFPMANERFVYRPGDEPGKVEKTDMHEVWKTVTRVKVTSAQNTRICSLHFSSSDYLYGDTTSGMRRTLKKSAIPSRKLPDGQKETFDKSAISLVEKSNMADEIIDDKENAIRVCMLSEYIKNEKDLQTATGIESFEILNAIIDMIAKHFFKESEIITPRDRVIMTYVMLKQNLDYRFLNMLFHCDGAEKCEEIFHTTLRVLSECFKTLIALPLYEKMSESWPVHFSEIKIVLDCIEIQGRDSCYQVIVGSSLGGIISYISEPYKKDEYNANIFRESRLTKLLRPGDGVMVDREFPHEQVCKINGWKCVKPKSLKEQKYLKRFNQTINNFRIVGSTRDKIEEILIVICGTMNMSTLVGKSETVEID